MGAQLEYVQNEVPLIGKITENRRCVNIGSLLWPPADRWPARISGSEVHIVRVELGLKMTRNVKEPRTRVDSGLDFGHFGTP